MERFFQYFFDGLSFGAVYALLALGLVVIYRGTGHLNFAQGDTIPNGASVPLDATGGVCVYTSATTDLLIDINGYFAYLH